MEIKENFMQLCTNADASTYEEQKGLLLAAFALWSLMSTWFYLSLGKVYDVSLCLVSEFAFLVFTCVYLFFKWFQRLNDSFP